jgi:catechol 2,3-dioxygenase-like lactoylglutathione lyase family enzyme
MTWAGVNHLAMVTPDMEATTAFYHDVLGMELVATLGHGDANEPYPYRHYFFRFGDGQTIAFFEWPGVDTGDRKPAGQPAGGRVFDHLSFNVPTVEELLALRQRLKDAGVEVTPVVDHTVIYSIYFDDPVNGASLEASVWVQDVTRVRYWGDPAPTPTAARVAKEVDLHAVKPRVPPELGAP